MPAYERRACRRSLAVDEIEIDHGLAAMRFTFRAGLQTRLAANAPGGIDVEDVIPDAYVQAYAYLCQFAGRASFSTWLTRIAVHEALGRLRLRDRNQQLEGPEDGGELPKSMVKASFDPEQSASRAELGQLLEAALLDLPVRYRAVLMLRATSTLQRHEENGPRFSQSEIQTTNIIEENLD